MKIIQNLVFIFLKQGLPLRGDDEDTSNFYQLALLRANDDPAFLAWTHQRTMQTLNSFAQPGELSERTPCRQLPETTGQFNSC